MYEQLHEKSLKADKNSKYRIGSLPLCIALDCDDIGACTINGEKHYITWGRNLDKEQQKYYIEKTGFTPVWVGAHKGSCELILPGDEVKMMLPILYQWEGKKMSHKDIVIGKMYCFHGMLNNVTVKKYLGRTNKGHQYEVEDTLGNTFVVTGANQLSEIEV